MKLKRKNTIGLYYVCTDHDDSADKYDLGKHRSSCQIYTIAKSIHNWS